MVFLFLSLGPGNPQGSSVSSPCLLQACLAPEEVAYFLDREETDPFLPHTCSNFFETSKLDTPGAGSRCGLHLLGMQTGAITEMDG
jgi:hypothetical protein